MLNARELFAHQNSCSIPFSSVEYPYLLSFCFTLGDARASELQGGNRHSPCERINDFLCSGFIRDPLFYGFACIMHTVYSSLQVIHHTLLLFTYVSVDVVLNAKVFQHRALFKS